MGTCKPDGLIPAKAVGDTSMCGPGDTLPEASSDEIGRKVRGLWGVGGRGIRLVSTPHAWQRTAAWGKKTGNASK